MLKAAPPELNLSVDKITIEMARFIELQGTFSKPVVQRQIKTCAGYMWWQQYGSGCPTLQWLATRILAQTTSAAAAESAWSEFDFVFNRRRNRLGKERASRLVYIHCNKRLLRRFQKVGYAENWVKVDKNNTPSSKMLSNAKHWPQMLHTLPCINAIAFPSWCDTGVLVVQPCFTPL